MFHYRTGLEQTSQGEIAGRSDCPAANTPGCHSAFSGTTLLPPHPKKGSISMAIDRTKQENIISPYTSRHSKMHSVSAMDGSQTDYQVTAPVGASSPCLQLFNGRLPLNSSQSDLRFDSSTAFRGLHKCRGGTTSPTTDHRYTPTQDSQCGSQHLETRCQGSRLLEER